MSATDVVEEVVEEGAKLVESAGFTSADGLYVSKSGLAFGSFVGGLVAVAAAYGAYRYGVKQTEAKYETILKEQIDEAKRFYALANKTGELSTPERAVAHLHGVKEPGLEEAVDALNRYRGQVDVDVEEERSVNIFVENTPDDDNFNLEEELETRTPDEPYVINSQEFLQAEPEFDQITITYYEGDGTLADDKDEEIPDIDKVVGSHNLQRFGHGSGDNRVVYIRNERMQTDFEVLRSDGKYAHEVLGFEHADGGPRARRLRNQPRKFRGEGE